MEQSFLSATILLIVITDPLGNIPPLLAALRGLAAARRRLIVFRECGIAFVVLALFMLFGRDFLALLRLSEETLKVAGGVILFLIALNMIFPGSGARFGESTSSGEPFIVPIAIPLVSGPSAMVTAMLIAGSDPGRMPEWIGAAALAIAVSLAVFLLADKLKDLLGAQVITAFERLMGLVLTAISVEMLLSGVASYIRHIGA
ncbi:MAG: MarC family protein [Spirochaetaceae bacterium]|nr:MarC family protein [Spirochaetaceae bacterium]